MNGTNCNDNERGLLPYPVILAATKGDPDAMKIVMQHYQSYIAHLSMRKIRDENGNERQYLLRHRRGLARTAASKAHAGCPIL